MTWLTHHSHQRPSTVLVQHPNTHICHSHSHSQSIVCVHGLTTLNKFTWDKVSVPCIVEEPCHPHGIISGMPALHNENCENVNGISDTDTRDDQFS